MMQFVSLSNIQPVIYDASYIYLLSKALSKYGLINYDSLGIWEGISNFNPYSIGHVSNVSICPCWYKK